MAATSGTTKLKVRWDGRVRWYLYPCTCGAAVCAAVRAEGLRTAGWLRRRPKGVSICAAVPVPPLALESADPALNSAQVVLLGESSVGKSSLVLRFVRGQFVENSLPTVGAAFLTQVSE